MEYEVLKPGFSLLPHFMLNNQDGVLVFIGLDQDPKHRYAQWVSHFNSSLKEKACTPEFLDETNGRDSTDLILKVYSQSDASDFVDATLDVDVNTYLPDDLLVKVDIATMAYGLEARSPFLDHKVMEFCASLPSWMKLRGLEKKYILKLASRDLLPQKNYQTIENGVWSAN